MTAPAAARVFHGLNGLEMRSIFLTEMKSQVYERLERYWSTELKVDWFYTMTLESYPAGDRQPKASVSGVATGTGEQIARRILDTLKTHYDRDTDFGQHITYPKVTWNQSLQMQAFSLPQTKLPEPPPAPAPASVDFDLRTRTSDPVPAVIQPATGDPRDAMIAEMQKQIAELRSLVTAPGVTGEPARVSSFDGKTPARIADMGLFAKTGFEGVENRPQQDMTGGAEVSPGAENAEPLPGRASALHSILKPIEAFDISIEHPSLENGGAGGADAIRRENGLNVPKPTRVAGGHIVDFPIGQL